MIGDPVRHSLSPLIHNAAYRAMGLDWVYVAFPVATGEAAAAVAAVRTLGLAGMSVTMPHKAAAAGAVDLLSPTAERLGVVNTVTPTADGLLGDSTDGAGFVDALTADFGWSPAGRSCVLLGTGGAARAVALALAGAGSSEVRVVGRRAGAVATCVDLVGSPATAGSPLDVAGADLVVNATPAGMEGGDAVLPFAIEASWLRAGQLVIDLVYAPQVTPLLRAGASRGATVANGLGMLVHQAARQIRAWTGQEAPVGSMLDAVRAATDHGRVGGDWS